MTITDNQNILAYPVLIARKKGVAYIDVPDFDIQIQKEDEGLGEAITTARKNITLKIEELVEEELDIPTADLIEYKKNKNVILTYVDIDLAKLLRKNKTLEELEEIDAARLYSMWDVSDNCLEFLKRQKVMKVTFSQIKYCNKINKLAAKYPDEVQVLKKNKDGSIFAKLPLNYLHIYRPNSGSKREYTEEEKQVLRERLAKRAKPIR